MSVFRNGSRSSSNSEGSGASVTSSPEWASTGSLGRLGSVPGAMLPFGPGHGGPYPQDMPVDLLPTY